RESGPSDLSMSRSYKKKHKCKANNAKNRSGPPERGPNRRGIVRLTVRARPGNPTQGLLVAGATVFACALGRGGISANKREGDGATPLASMRILSGYFRGDHVAARRTR